MHQTKVGGGTLHAQDRLVDKTKNKNTTIAYDQGVSPYHTLIAETIVHNARIRSLDHPHLFDFGCGVGNTIVEIERMVPGKFSFSIYDIDDTCLEQTRRKAPIAHSHTIDSIGAVWETSSAFDVVVSSHVLHYDFDFWQTISRLQSITKPGGLVVLAVPNAVSLPILLNSVFRRSYGTGPIVSWDWSSFENMLGQSGLTNVKIVPDYVPIPLLDKVPGMRRLEVGLRRLVPRLSFSLIAVASVDQP